MNNAEHIYNQLELAHKQKLLESVTVRPERTCTSFYVIFTRHVKSQNRNQLEELLRTKYNCRTDRLHQDGLMIVSPSVMSKPVLQSVQI